MAVLAAVVSAWAAWRWLGAVLGAIRVRRFDGPVRREARRSVAIRIALNLLLSVLALYLWAAELGLQPTEEFVGFLAAVSMISLTAAVVFAVMQPAERTPETLDLCRVISRRGEDPATSS